MELKRTLVLVLGVALLAAGSISVAGHPRQNHQGELEDRTYHPVRLKDLAKTSWTHVEVEARIGQIHQEADGDVHLDLVDGEADGVAEIIPTLTPAMPFPDLRTGMRVRVRGIARVDGRHGWGECHPVESIEILEQ